MTWSIKLPRYSITQRQINRVKGYEITFWDIDNKSTVLAFVKTKKEVHVIIAFHKKENNIQEHIYNSQVKKE